MLTAYVFCPGLLRSKVAVGIPFLKLPSLKLLISINTPSEAPSIGPTPTTFRRSLRLRHNSPLLPMMWTLESLTRFSSTALPSATLYNSRITQTGATPPELAGT